MSRKKEHRPNGAAALGDAAEGSASVFFCFCSFIFLYCEYLWIFLVYSIYIYVLNIFHLFPFVCFVIYSVNGFKSNFFIGGVVASMVQENKIFRFGVLF